MHEAVFLGALDYFKRFLARYLPCTAGAYVVLRALAHLHAHILREMAAAVAEARARGAAGAGRDGENIVFIKIVAQALVIGHAGDALYRALHRDDAHEPVAVRQDGSHALHTQAGIFLKRTANLRVLTQKLLIVDHHFEYAGGEDLHEIAVLIRAVDLAAAEDAVVHKSVERGLYLIHRPADLIRQPLRRALLAKPGGNGNIGLFVGHDIGHAVVFRGILIYLDEHTGSAAYDLCELDYFGSELCHNYLSYPFFVSIPEYDYN